MANKALIYLLMIFFLSLSHFFISTSHASRLGSLMEKPDHIDIPQQETLLDVKKEVEERMSMEEINDYPGSGANNRHLPPRQRGCVDC